MNLLVHNKQASLQSRVEVREPTPEKGKEFQKEETEGLLLSFDSIYDRWQAFTRVAKRSVIKQDPRNILEVHINTNINTIQKDLSELNVVYDGYRSIDNPVNEMHRKLDNCLSVTRIVVQNAQSQIQGTMKETIWPDGGSVFTS